MTTMTRALPLFGQGYGQPTDDHGDQPHNWLPGDNGQREADKQNEQQNAQHGRSVTDG